MRLPYSQLDAFTDRPFSGNPAAVMPLDAWLPDSLLQAIAAEHNLSETAFVVPEPGGAAEHYHLRWFTPAVEVSLCGHATLAAAWVLLHETHPDWPEVHFRSESGRLTVRRIDDGRLELDFPAQPPVPRAIPSFLPSVLGLAVRELHAAGKGLALLADEAAVRAAATPDAAALEALETDGLIVTAPGDDVHFVSRYFAADVGIPEDPVTGSAHCVLVPFWSKRLGLDVLEARQVSARGGSLRCTLAGDRVRLAGRAVPVAKGTLTLPDGLA